MGVLMESSQANQARAGQGFRPVDCYLQACGKSDRLFGLQQPYRAPSHQRDYPAPGSGSPLRRKYEELARDEPEDRPPSPRVTSMPPPKKKWMKNYMEEEPCPLVAGRNGLLVRAPPPAVPASPGRVLPPSAPPSAPPPSAPIAIPALAPAPSLHHLLPAAHLMDLELPRARSNSNGSGGRAAGTREVHNKLEKNRRAHLKECFELLKRQLPASPDDKKSSNLSILDSAIKYIQVLKRRELECEHEMERLAREKISSQQRLAALRRGSPVTPRLHHNSNHDRESVFETEEAVRSLSRVASPGSCSSLSMMHSDHLGGPPSPRVSPPLPLAASLDLSTRPLRPARPTVTQQAQLLSIQPHNGAIYPRLEQPPSPPSAVISRPTPSQIISPFSHHIPNGIVATPGTLNLTVNPSVKTIRGQKVAVASNLPTLTVTTVNHGQVMAVNHSQAGATQSQGDRKILTTVPSSVNGQTTIVHPAQLHLPLSQMMGANGLVMSPAIQMFYTTPQTLRVLQGQGGALAPIDLPSTAANSPIQRMREVQPVGEAGVGGGAGPPGSLHHRSNGTGGNSSVGQHHHIAIKPQPEDPNGSIMMNGLTPLVVSKGGTHIIASSQHLTGKMVSGPILKTGHQLPMSLSAQYLGSAGVKPVVVVSSSNGGPPPHSSS